MSNIKGSYQWNNSIADAPSPDNLVKDTTVYVVKPNAKLTLDFEGKTPEKVSAGLWENQSSVPLPAAGDAILLPSEPGVYVITVWAEWPSDDRVSYAVKVEVRELGTSQENYMPKEMPDDFAFSVRFGVGSKNVIDSFNGIVIKDLIAAGE